MFTKHNFALTMETFIPTLILTIIVLTFFVFGLGFKMLFDKKAEFRGGCASNNPMLRNEIGECTVCGRKPEGDCEVVVEEKNNLPEIK